MSEELGEPMSIKHVARMIGCSPWTVRQTLIPKGLPHLRSGARGRLIFYHRQVEQWILRMQKLQGGRVV
jgi:hypothetical protein